MGGVELSAADRATVNLVLGKDPRSEGFMPGWAIELARQKLLFFTLPKDLTASLDDIIQALDAEFQCGDETTRTRCIAFLLGVADSLNSIVELHHNLQSAKLHGDGILPDSEAAACREMAQLQIVGWEAQSPEAARTVLDCIKTEDLAANKGDNLFISWAKSWEAEHGVEPYSSTAEFLKCFKGLYQPGTYYVDLFLAWEQGETKTQFFNDYGLQAARCRKIGSLGGTTNPAIAVMGEDDFDGKGNIWGDAARNFITRTPNKWREVRKVIAKEQTERKQKDDWGATAFTEWVVVDAMLGLRSIFLLEGLGRVAFQLRPDWHDDEKKLTHAGGKIYDLLCQRVKVFDEILLEGVGEPYGSLAGPRIGKSNNHFKIACTSQAALNVVRSFNAGFSVKYPGALKHRMFTNMTLSYEVPQMVASSLAVEEGIAEYEKRTGEKVDDGQGGSVITSMIGRFNDAIRIYRIEQLLSALSSTSRFRAEVKPAAIKSLNDAPLSSAEFIAEVMKVGLKYDPEAEEDAIDHAGTLATKRAVMYLEHKYGWKRTRMLTASKRKFHQNTDLLDVPFSTDFGNIQRMWLELHQCGEIEIGSWRTLCDGMNPDGTPAKGSIWEKRAYILSLIWPDWRKAFDPDGVKPEEYAKTIYVPPTLNQFIGFWHENVSRAHAVRTEGL